MYLTKCACGDSEKNFKINIGPFFVNECCEAKGYDFLGQKPAEAMSKQESDDLLLDLDTSGLELPTESSEPSEGQDPTDEPEPNQDVEASPETTVETQPAPTPVVQPTQTPKKNRRQRN